MKSNYSCIPNSNGTRNVTRSYREQRCWQLCRMQSTSDNGCCQQRHARPTTDTCVATSSPRDIRHHRGMENTLCCLPLRYMSQRHTADSQMMTCRLCSTLTYHNLGTVDADITTPYYPSPLRDVEWHITAYSSRSWVSKAFVVISGINTASSVRSQWVTLQWIYIPHYINCRFFYFVLLHNDNSFMALNFQCFPKSKIH